MPDDEPLDEMIARIGREAEEADPNTPIPEGTKITRGHDQVKTLQVRLNEDEYAEVEALAAERGLPASTVARSILLNALRPTTTLDGMLAHVEHEVSLVRRKLHADA